MSYIINLSSISPYSIEKSLSAFVDLCEEGDHYFHAGPFAYFRRLINYIWVCAAYKKNYRSLIEPYKLGMMSTQDFLRELSNIFHFLNGNEEIRHQKLTRAWNSGVLPIKRTSFDLVIKKADTERVYLISNSNELNIQEILRNLAEIYPDLDLTTIDISRNADQNPIQVLPNIDLVTSYRYNIFKNATAGLIQILANQIEQPITLVSQYGQDLAKGRELGLAVIPANEFYMRQQFDDYINQREKYGKEYYFTQNLLSFFRLPERRYSATVKISAARKVLENWVDMDALRNTLTNDESLALHQGKLGKLFRNHLQHQFLERKPNNRASSEEMEKDEADCLMIPAPLPG